MTVTVEKNVCNRKKKRWYVDYCYKCYPVHLLIMHLLPLDCCLLLAFQWVTDRGVGGVHSTFVALHQAFLLIY